MWVQEKRRAEIEEKLELAAAREKQKVARQRKELYEQRRHQQQRIGFLANQVELAEVVCSFCLFLIFCLVILFVSYILFVILFFSVVVCFLHLVCYVCMFLLWIQYEEWNLHDRRLIGYIKTKAKPAVFYLPVQQNETTEKLLKETEQHIEGFEEIYDLLGIFDWRLFLHLF